MRHAASICMRQTSDLLLLAYSFFNDAATPEIYTLSLHDALPIWLSGAHTDQRLAIQKAVVIAIAAAPARSEEHTSELQSRFDLVCRLLLEKKKPQSYCSHNCSSRYIKRTKCNDRSTDQACIRMLQ